MNAPHAARVLTSTEAAFVRRALGDARVGRASVPDIARAYVLADEANLDAVMSELRRYLSLSADRGGHSLAFSFVFGIAVGITTNLLMKRFP